jgi:hypothetical protein
LDIASVVFAGPVLVEVAAELERRWETALRELREAERRRIVPQPTVALPGIELA